MFILLGIIHEFIFSLLKSKKQPKKLSSQGAEIDPSNPRKVWFCVFLCVVEREDWERFTYSGEGLFTTSFTCK